MRPPMCVCVCVCDTHTHYKIQILMLYKSLLRLYYGSMKAKALLRLYKALFSLYKALLRLYSGVSSRPHTLTYEQEAYEETLSKYHGFMVSNT